MSLVTLIRDYVDVANSSEQLNGSTLSSLTYYTFTFFFTVLKQALVYCFTFNWLRDLSYFCLTPPLFLSSFPNFGHVNATFASQHQPLSNLLAFPDSNFSTGIGIVFFAFLNGFFSCLHLSAANLITIQRMLVQGVPAGLCSAFGTVVGQFSFLACIVFGFRGLLFPWLALEPVHFLLGTVILLSIASAAAQDRRTPTIQWSAKSTLLIYTCTSILLTWCEQTAIFQWLGNISFGTEPTFLETISSREAIHTVFGSAQQLTESLVYLFAFLLGNLLGAFFLGYGLQHLLEWILRSRGVAIYYGLVKQANLPLATLIFAFGFGSLPYYGFDYLITKGFGFVPKEPYFQQTLFSPINLVSKTSQAKEPSQGRLEDQLALLFTLEGERTKSFAVDTTPFDDGQYLKANQKRPQAFEDLNYRGEHLWTNRLARISNIREQANQTQSSFLGPIFSWMRAFLWGDGPTATDTSFAKKPNNNNGFVSHTDFVDKEKHMPKEVHTISASHTTEGGKVMQDGSNIEDDTHSFGEKDSVPSKELVQSKTSTIEGGKGWEKKVATQKRTTPENREELLFDTIKQKSEITSEKEQVDSYVKEFNQQFDKGFSNFYNTDPQSLIEVEDQWQEKRIKEKCYTNPIYTFLLNTEIDAFLTRQPKSHFLSPQEETLLLKRRQLLNNYYDTLALTSQVATSDVLGQLLPPLMVQKSYSNAIYNHQFKGTLKVARRLFSIKKANEMSKDETKNLSDTVAYNDSTVPRTRTTIKDQMQSKGNTNGLSSLKFAKLKNQMRAVKFDQPLFSNEKENVQKIVFHEELPSESDPNQGTTTLSRTYPDDKQRKLEEDTLKDGTQKDTGASHTTISKVSVREAMQKRVSSKMTRKRDNSESENEMGNKNENIFLLEQVEPLPLYSSWDQGLRKLILTNRYQSRATAGYAMSEFFTNFKDNKVNADFTIWPIPDPLSDNKLSTKDSKVLPSEIVRSIRSQSFTDIPSMQSKIVKKRLNDDNNKVDKLVNNVLQLKNHQNRFLFQSKAEPVTNDMINALLQWQKVTKENKQLSKEDKQAAKEKISYWPENVSRASWSNELIDNDIEFDEPNKHTLKKQAFLWEFTLPNHGGFLWPGTIWNK